MRDDLLEHYNRELSHIRKSAQEFARANPDIAPRLRLDSDAAQDPFVERLIEGFAYLTARIRRKLDDEFPEIAAAMLSSLYPNALAPYPSLSIAQFELDPGQASLGVGYALPRGSRIETDPVREIDGESCEFRTCFETRIFPLRISEAGVIPVSLSPTPALAPGATQVIRVRLATFATNIPLNKMAAASLTFFLHGEDLHTNALFEVLLANTSEIVVRTGAREPAEVRLETECIEAIGFSEEESLLPADARTFRAHALLSEYFALPQKFRFFRLRGLDRVLRHCSGPTADILFFVRGVSTDLQNNIQPQTFRLGCTPIVNLFPQPAEPIDLTQRRSTYPVIPDSRRARALEVFSIDTVTATGADNRVTTIQPFFFTGHAAGLNEQRAYWSAVRKPAGYREGRLDEGTELDMMFVNLDYSPAQPPGRAVGLVTTCLNRDLPAQIPHGPDRPKSRLMAGGPVLIRFLTPPTPTRRVAGAESELWRLISALSLNHLSLVEGDRALEALREILLVHDPVRTADRANKIAAIRKVTARRETGLVTQGDAGLCRGIHVLLDLDERGMADNSAYLFSSVLERFFALYCSINSFSQLTVRSTSRSDTEFQWLPRSGQRQIL